MSARQAKGRRTVRRPFSTHMLVLDRCIDTGKVRFATEARALAVLEDRAARQCGERRAYWCRYCEGGT